MGTKKYMRELLCEAVNHLVKNGCIDLDSLEDSEGRVEADLFGKRSIVIWRGVGYGELFVTAWWGIKNGIIIGKGEEPLNSNMKDALEVCCSAWLERKDGKWIQGSGKNHITSTYCSVSGRSALAKLPDVSPVGFEKVGRFYL